MFDAPCFGELLEKMRAELRSAVGGNCCWDAKLLDPTVCEGV